MDKIIAACFGTALLLSPLTAVAGQPGGPDFTPGFYRVTPVDRNSRASEKPQMLCAADAQALLRLGHGNASGCHDRFVQPGQDRTTVTYSCAADGWGRSELRRETPELYQLDTQGIAHRQPFAFRAEARRIGSCPGTGQNLPRR